AAVRFPLGHPAVASVLVGARSAAQVQDTAERCRRPIPGALWSTLRERELLRADAPVPEGHPV
ncbi:aldo/keto reductase, partial [Streptomyces sp. 4F]